MIDTKIKSPWYHKLAFVIGGLLLIFYPFVLMASLMSLLGMMEFDSTFLLALVSQIFLWLSLLYPIFYIGCLWFYVRNRESKYRNYVPWLPFVYVLTCILFMFLWFVIEEYYAEPYEFNYVEYANDEIFDEDHTSLFDPISE